MAKTGATTYSVSFYQKDGAFVSDRTVDLNGKVLHFAQGGIDFIKIDPVAGQEAIELSSFNNTGNGNAGSVFLYGTNTNAEATLMASFNGVNEPKIYAFADTTTATLAYTADTHTFNGEVVLDDLAGNGAGVVAVDNVGLLSWSAAGGGSFGYPQILLAQVFS